MEGAYLGIAVAGVNALITMALVVAVVKIGASGRAAQGHSEKLTKEIAPALEPLR